MVNKMMEVLLDWNLDSKLSTITVDNCSVNDGVVQSLVRKLKSDELLLRGEFLHMRCCAHILNLIVKDGLDIIGDGLERIRNSCVFWTSTPKKIEMFEAEAQLSHINSTKKLCYDVKTRWNSTFLMLETALIYKGVFHRLQFRDPQYKTVPTDLDWENAKLVNEKLKIFFTITELFSGTKYTTANHYFPKICEIRLYLMEWILDSNPKFSEMATKMMKKFKKYWSVIHGIMGVATILDPRCKKDLIDYYYLKIYGKDYFEEEVDKIVVLFRRLFREYASRGSNDHSEQSAIEDSMRKSDLPKDFLLSRRKKQKVEDELNLYINGDLVADSENFNVLSWWMTNGHKYPTLQKIAQDVFSIPVSTVASESAFSMGGRIISPLRNRLHPKLVEALACGQNWLRAQYQGLNLILNLVVLVFCFL
ncbi:Zinc finger BED domain-containing protein DAYSLEEPER [Rhynchospora pubera]|uniref:Zinc finger BED domain-containing protein DAYSLEEPER n=1 Tax=Rhynchospora pubera TaxID=906938 RepID=A0AAV8BWI0_9POAL|nr:Zinc finger BED domain-containing protein DAYSLEEPER [Rhynchospora pubera]